MSRIIIGIHGLGNKPPPKSLKQWWKKSIREGLKNIGYPRFYFRFELAYWADILHPQPLNPAEKDQNNPFHIEFPYLPAKEFRRIEPGKVRRKVLHFIEKQIDKIILNPDLSINFSGISDFILRRYFQDLDKYYSMDSTDPADPGIPFKMVIRKRLANVLQKHRHKKILLISHSMGSIIAYDVLTMPSQQQKVDTFVTCGSPLGLPVVMGKLAAEQKREFGKDVRIRTPENIKKNWYNFSDLHDRVAMNYNLSDDYGENSKGVKPIDFIVHNDYEKETKRNPHKSYGYLRTPEMADVLYKFLTHNRNQLMIKISNIFHELIENWFKSKFLKIN